MVFSAVFEQFVRSSPACVMHRAVMENVFAPAELDALFRRTAINQYERELLFSTVVDLVSLVVCRVSKTVHAAYVRKREEVGVSAHALYDKLDGVEIGTSRALVQFTAERVGKLIHLSRGARASLLKGYKTRILDGNHLGGTDHRLKVLRGTAAGALPGQTLVLLDPQRMLIEDVIPCENGHTQERALLDQVLPCIRKGDLLIDDRNFCTLGFLFGLKRQKACFITRQHARMPWTAVGKECYVGRCATGRVYEGTAELRDPQTGKTTHVRRITVKLSHPTRDGDEEIHLLTNLPAQIKAIKIAELYRRRWTLEQAFNELTTHLRCELNTLGYPKAALFAFCVAACAYNLLAAVKGALRGVHGEEKMEAEVSNYFLTDEISGVYKGMMIALPAEDWEIFQTMPPARLASCLRRWARTADLKSYPKHPRGPKKPKARRPNAQFKHVATAELLGEAKKQRKKPRSASP
jgi:Transposase DDE domain